MTNVELVIFDMDGLMFDTERIGFYAWNKAALEYGYEIFLETYINTIGLNSKNTEKYFKEYFGDKFPYKTIREKRFEITDMYIEEKGVPIKDGLFELLKYLKTCNLKLAVATSSDREKAYYLLTKANVFDYFDYILCGDEIINGKPDPEMFIKTAEKFGIESKKCIVLEDSEYGIIAAKNSGMIPIIIPDMINPCNSILEISYKKLQSLNEVKMLIESNSI